VIDFEERVRETLRRRAMDVQPKLEVPTGLVPRAGMRIARNLSALVVAVAVVAVGAVAGVRAFTGSSRLLPVSTPAPACQANELSGTSSLAAPEATPQQKANIREGQLLVINKGREACSLVDSPSVRILGASEKLLDVTGTLDPSWKVHGYGPPPGWPVVTLQPGQTAAVRVKWTKWCSGAVPTTWQIQLPGNRGNVVFAVNSGQDVPSCEGKPAPSKLERGPFEPLTG
jgi:uncharacterized protein DUF4232